MKKFWYLYKNYYNFGMRKDLIASINEIEALSGLKVSKKDLNKINGLGFCILGEYKMNLEKAKE